MCGLAGIVSFDGTPVPREALERMGAALRASRARTRRASGGRARARPRSGLVAPAALDHRPLARGRPAARQRGRLRPGAAERRDLQLPRAAARAGARATRSARRATPRSIVHGYEDAGRRGRRAAGRHVRARALGRAAPPAAAGARRLRQEAALLLAATRAASCSGPRSRRCWRRACPPRSTTSALAEYLAFGYVPTPRTLFRGVRKLPPASTLVVDADGVPGRGRTGTCTFPPRARRARVAGRGGASACASCSRRPCASGCSPTCRWACCSRAAWTRSAVAALAAASSPGASARSRSGFEGHSFYDERAARGSAWRATLGSDAPRGGGAPAGGGARWRRCSTTTTSPSATRRRCPRTWWREAARRHVTVVLNGDGGDETFAGYDRFRAALLADAAARARLRSALRAAVARCCPEAATPTARCGALQRFAARRRCRSTSASSPGARFFDVPRAARALDRDGLVRPRDASCRPTATRSRALRRRARSSRACST